MVLAALLAATALGFAQTSAGPTDPAEPGYCPSTADATCPEKLKKYVEAHADLLKANKTFYGELEKSLFGKNWPKASEQGRKLKSEFEGLVGKINLKGKAEEIGANNFVAKLSEAADKKVTSDAAWLAWQQDPLDQNGKPDETKKTAANTALVAYRTSLLNVFKLSSTFSARGAELTALENLLTAAENSLKAVKTEASNVGDLELHAEALRVALAAQTTILNGAIASAEAAATELLKAGGTLAAKPQEAPGGGAGGDENIRVVDALYGDHESIYSAWVAWKGTKSSQLAPEDFVSDVRKCRALDFVRVACEFHEASIDLCLNKNWQQGKPDDIKPCAPANADYTIPAGQHRPVVKAPRTSCAFVLKPDTICGVPVIAAPASNRFALVLYRCGSAGVLRAKPVQNNQNVYLLCDKG
jgi:hypothetical protein